MSPDQFRDLLDDAMGPPPSPGVHGIVDAGRARLRRHRAVRGGVVASAVIAVVSLGAALVGPTGQSPQLADDPPPTARAATPPPTVLSDVIDAAFTTPGAAASRRIRVQTFLRSWSVTWCGGTGEPLDSTSMRFEQNLLPDLDLIREKGFVEPVRESLQGARGGCDLGGELERAAPTFQAWSALTATWHETVEVTLDEPQLTDLTPETAQCLTDATGRAIDQRDPINSFFDHEDSRSITRTAAVAYADCTAAYFGELRTLLEAQRPALVEANEQVLRAFSSELAGLGYRA